jgi:hypothetical protein
MKCQEYDPDEYGCMSPVVLGRCPLVSEKQCHGGWITFWTPAERAGLKAMGREYIFNMNLFALTGPYRSVKQTGAKIIRTYVKAARGIKEED